MSGALSTAKPGLFDAPLCSRPTRPIWPSTSLPSLEAVLICAVVLMSSRARSTAASCPDATFTPPTRSAAFSCQPASGRRALVAAPSDSTKTEAPRACGVTKASAWMDTNRSACTRRALRTRSCRARRSRRRASSARGCWGWWSLSRSLRATPARHPSRAGHWGRWRWGSSPPWPGSSAMTIRRSALPARVWVRAGGLCRSRRCRPRWAAGAGACWRSILPIRSPAHRSWRAAWSAGCQAGWLTMPQPVQPLAQPLAATSRGTHQRGDRVVLDLGVEVKHQAVLVVETGASEKISGATGCFRSSTMHDGRRVLAHAHASDGVVGATLPSSSRRLGLSSRPSTSITRRSGVSTRKCLAARRLSD